MNLSLSISLSPAQYEALKAESPTFCTLLGEHEAQSSSCLDEYKNIIKAKFPYYPSNVIPAIKWIREETQHKPDVLCIFEKAGYDTYNGGHSLLSLTGAKKFVDNAFERI